MKITKTDLAQLSSRLTAQQTPKATKFTATADTSMIDAYIIKLAYHAAYYTLRAMARDEKSGNADTFRRGADAFTFYLSTPNAYTDADAVQANAAAYAERDANAPKHTNASTRVLSAAESKAAAKLTAERAALAEIESRAAKLTAEIDRAAFDAANAIERATITAPRRFVKYGIIRNRSALIIDARGTIEKRRRAAERVETLTAERAAFSRERTKLTAAARKRVDRAAAALTKAQREILKMLPYYPVSMIALERGTTERAVYMNIKKARAAIIAADVSTYDRYIDDANAAETERLMRIAYKKTR